MGIYAETSGASITCKTKKVAEEVFDKLCKQELKDFALEIEDINIVDNEVYLPTLSSGRVQNLEYQCEQLWKHIKDIKGVQTFNAPFLQEADGCYFEN